MTRLDPKPLPSLGSHQTESDKHRPEQAFNQELVSLIAQHIRLLLLGPLIVGLVAYGIAALMPKEYTSTAYLRLDGPTTRSAQTLMHSSQIAERALSKYPAAGKTPEARQRFLNRNLHVVDTSPDTDAKVARYVRVELSASEPHTAQSIASALIDAWFDATKPGPVARAALESELSRVNGEAAADSALIDRLQKEATNLVMPNSREGELATPISNLIVKRDHELASVIDIQTQLAGVSRDVIASPPDVPVEPSWPDEIVIAILAAIAAVPLLLAVILLGRFFGPDETVRAALSRQLTQRRKKLR